MKQRIFKAHENRGLILSLAAASLLLGLVGCGKAGSDPVSEYKDVDAKFKPHTEKPRNQAVLDRSYSIDPEKNITFVEGDQTSFKIRVRVFFPVTSYELKLGAVPQDVTGLTMNKIEGEAGAFQITWTPPKGIVPTDRAMRTVRYSLELTNVKSNDPGVEEIFRSINKVQEFEFAVYRTGKHPTITNVTLGEEIAQGALVPFTVDVSDPASYEGFAPRLDIYFQGTNKTESGYEANGATYVRNESTPKHLGGGVWRFSYVFDAKNNDVGAQMDRDGKRVDGAEHLQTRMMMKAVGASNIASSELSVVRKIKFVKPQTAEPEYCPAPVKKAQGKAPAAKPATSTKTTPVKPTAPASSAAPTTVQ